MMVSSFMKTGGTALVAKASRITFHDGPVIMTQNSGTFSGAILVAEGGHVDMSMVSSLLFW